MQLKESKSSKHFYFSLVKSAFRIGASILLINNDLVGTGVFLIIAEVLGILEEF